EFSFQDLVLLRAGHSLLRAHVPVRRVRRALSELARQLPADRPLSGVRICADGRDVLARDGDAAWRPEGGQVVFSFAVDDLARRAGIVVPVHARRPRAATSRLRTPEDPWECFERGLRLERDGDARGAGSAYLRALQLDPTFADAYVNLGR